MPIPCVIAVAARKGGVGKTTVACWLSCALASDGARVLLVDLDPQSNAGFVLGVDPTADGSAVLLVGDDVEPQTAADGLYVLPGGPALHERAVQRLDPTRLKAALSRLDYDVAVIDCPPGDDHLERLAMRAADTALVVMDAHPLAITGAERVIEDIEADRADGLPVPERVAIVMSRLDLRRGRDKGLAEHLASVWPDMPKLIVRQDEALAQTCDGGRMPAGGRSAEDLMNLARWGRGEV